MRIGGPFIGIGMTGGQTPASFASTPAPPGHHWEYVTDQGAIVTDRGVPVVDLVRNDMVEIARTTLMKNILRPRTVMITSDSIGESGTSGYSSGIWQYAGTNGFLVNAIYVAGLRLIGNMGVSGNTVDQMDARFDADIVANAPDVVLILGGTNNLTAGMTNAALANMFNKIESMVIKALRAGILPIIVTPPPKAGAGTELKNAQPFFYWLAEYYGVPLIDLFRMMVNPTDASFISGYDSDGTHPDWDGAEAVFQSIGDRLKDIPSLIPTEYLAAVSESATGAIANIIRNGSFALGTAPSSLTGWTTNTTNNTITSENPTLPETGKVSKHVKTSTNGIYGLYGTGFNVTTGDELIMSGKLKISGMSATTGGPQVVLDFNIGSDFKPINAFNHNGTFQFSARQVVPSGVATANPALFIDQAGTFEMSNFTLINRTAMGAIWTPGQQGL